jgi:arylsulfatase A-like enzyme
MKKLLITLIALLPLCGMAGNEKPNFLFIFADDQSYQTINALGYEEVITPNLDKLVNSGTSFTNTYNMGGWNGAICVASRTMLNTVRFVWRALENEKNLKQLAEEGKTWGKMLNKKGYETYMTGKWHVKAEPELLFDNVVHERPGMPPGSPTTMPEQYHRPVKGELDPFSPWDMSLGGFWEGGKHWSEVVADDAEMFLEKAGKSDKPFFMYLAFNAPHDPRQSPKRFVDMYPLEDIAIPVSFQKQYPYKDSIGNSAKLRDEALAPFPRTEFAVRTHRQEYNAIITHMDEQIGRILKALEETGKADNTYILFTADHGLAVGNHGFIGKQNMYEHSMRPPMIVVGPDVPAGERRDALVYLQDIMATTLDLAGVDKPKFVEFNSLMPLIRSKNKKSAYGEIYGAYQKDLQRMIRVGDMKLIAYPNAGRVRLYDLAADPEELNDLAGDPRRWDEIHSLFRQLLALEKKMDSPIDLGKFFPDLAK